MTTWLESTNVHQNGEPVTRKIKIPEMGEEIWFTDNAYAEVSNDVADILANNIDSISKLASAPSSPGTYYGDANSNTTVQINISDGVFDAVTLESLDADSISTGVGRVSDYLNSESRPNGAIEYTPVGSTSHSRDKGVIALETDDARTETYTETYPDLKEHRLPWSIAVPPEDIGSSSYCTWAEVEEMHAYGAEIATHGQGISDVDTASESDAYKAIIDYKRQIESRNIPTTRWVPTADPDFQNKTDFKTFAGKLVTGNFLSIGNVKSSKFGRQGISTGGFWDHRQYIDGKTETYVKDLIDLVKQSSAAITLSWHPHSVGDTGSITRTELQNIFAYLAQERDAGNINVVTPTMSRYLVGDCRDNNLVTDESFELGSINLTSDYNQSGRWRRSSTGVVINTTTARTGSNSLEIPVDQNAMYGVSTPPMSSHVAIECYARAKPSGGSGRLVLNPNTPADYASYTGNMGTNGVTVGDTWTKVKTIIGLNRDWHGLRVYFDSVGTDTILVDDVHIYPI